MSIRKRTWTTKAGEAKTAWVVDYTDGGGTRRQKSFSRKKDADAWAASTAVAVRQGTHTADSASPTVKEAAKLWLERVEADGRERSTLQQYRGHVNHHIVPMIGRSKLSQLTTPGLERFRDDLIARLSRPTARKVLTSLKSILTEAQRRGLVAQNVATPVRIEVDRRQRVRPQIGVTVPTKEEVNAILTHAEGKWRALFVTAAFCGLRASELRGLTWPAVDLDARMIRIRERADCFKEVGRPKSAAGERDVPMAAFVVNTLREWKAACPANDLALVFPDPAGGIMLHGRMWRALVAVEKAAGLVDGDGQARYRLHALRHFFAALMIEQGFPAKRLQGLLGHSTIVMTYDRYGHWFPSEVDDFTRLAAAEASVVQPVK